MNFAENLLYPTPDVDPNALAIIAATEVSRTSITWAELRQKVHKCQIGLISANIQIGDRIAGYVANHIDAVVAMLAATSLGAIWTAVSPDTGVTAVLERLRQIEPVLLFCDNAVIYNGKIHETQSKVQEIMHGLPSLRKLVVFNTIDTCSIKALDQHETISTIDYSAFTDHVYQSDRMQFTQLPADHPVYILYSSGTTGAPKCIVHGAIGTLLQHKKEHILHCDIHPGDRFFYFTTCTWMMWHWLVSGLASGATLVLYDGSPFRYRVGETDTSQPDDIAMPRLIDELQINQFGTSAKYLSILEGKSILPRDHNLSLSCLKAIYSTGSSLAPSTFSYVYRAFGPNINLASITGGTDIISLFGAPCSILPVYCGEIQCAGLGMAIRVYNHDGKDVTESGEAGDLVCIKPFVSQPVTFWGEAGEEKYRKSYFDKFSLDSNGKTGNTRIWHHGDFVRFDPVTGGMYMLGRSDGILKPGGVRFGSAEIYNLVSEHFSDVVEDSLCIGRRREKDKDETVVLFLKMRDDKECNQDLIEKIKGTIRKDLSARHVPGIICSCPEIPVTGNGKK